MKAVKYFANILSDGHIPIPEKVKKELAVRKGSRIEVILSYTAEKEASIKFLQSKIQQDARERRAKLSIKEINELVHKLRKVNA